MPWPHVRSFQAEIITVSAGSNSGAFLYGEHQQRLPSNYLLHTDGRIDATEFDRRKRALGFGETAITK